MVPFVFLVALSGSALVLGARLVVEDDSSTYLDDVPPLMYCAAPWPLGSEGILPPSLSNPEDDFKLQQVQVIIRHGSRNPVNQVINQVNAPTYTCSPMSKNIEEMKEAWVKLFPLVDDNPKTKDLPFVTSDENGVCTGGQLIEQGIQQQLMKGRAFVKAYGSLLTNLSPNDVIAESTRVQRARASTAAFLSGVLGDLKTAQERGQFKIIKNPLNPSGIPINGSCDRSKRGSDLPHTLPSECNGLDNELMSIFNHSIQETFKGKDFHPLHYTDSLLSHACVTHELPCGSHSCITDELAENLVECENSLWKRLYNPDHCMAAVPFLEKIVTRMSTNKRLVVFGGHDTTIMAIAGALQFSDAMRPRIASHIAFEVWTSKKSPSEPYVRIVYNGHAVTPRLVHCSKELCPLSQFIESIQDNVKRYGANNFEEACAME